MCRSDFSERRIVHFLIMALNNTPGGAAGATDEERLLIARAAELSARSDGVAAASNFMTPREQRIVFESLKGVEADRLFFWGGFIGAERRAAVFLPTWTVGDQKAPDGVFSAAREEHFLRLLDEVGCTDILNDFILPVKLLSSGYEKLSHRDWLGSLVGLGLKRQMLGDIVVHDGGAVLFARRESMDFIVSQLKRAGRDSVRAEIAEPDIAFTVQRSFEDICQSVASMRLDGAVRALCSLSREKAASLVESGNVEVNYYTEKRVDHHLSPGDILTVRGFGKFVIYRCEDVTKRGRIRLFAGKYI